MFGDNFLTENFKNPQQRRRARAWQQQKFFLWLGKVGGGAAIKKIKNSLFGGILWRENRRKFGGKMAFIGCRGGGGLVPTSGQGADLPFGRSELKFHR